MSKAPLIVGNWKMHGTVGESLKRVTALDRKLDVRRGVDIVICPPFTALYSVGVAIQDLPLALGAQNAYFESEGAFTGETSSVFLKDVGCDYVIVGHSERRHLFKEDDQMINRKLHAVLGADMTPIFCVGETQEERKADRTFERLEEQLSVGLQELHVHDIESLCVAYEPVWAIGTGQNAEPDQIGEVHDWVRNFLAKRFDAPMANAIRLLYGGSVKSHNTASLCRVQNVDGLLVGGASLEADDFVPIIQAALHRET